MSSLVYKFLSSYFNKYFKNIEHLDLSLKDSKIKIDSIVPHVELFSNLLNFPQYKLKIQSGMLKNLELDFPLNFVNNPIRITCGSIDLYISDDLSSSSLRSEESTSLSSLSSLSSEDSFWEKMKDDIVANLVIKVNKVNIYYFTQEFIIRFEVCDLVFSPSETETEDEPESYKEVFIKNSKKSETHFRKCLLLGRVRASLQENLTDDQHNQQNKTFLKNLKLCIFLDYFNPNSKGNPCISEACLIKKIFLDNFLFDYDISEFEKLRSMFQKFKLRNLNNFQESEREEERSSHYLSKSTLVYLNNSNINFYFDNYKSILFYFVVEKFRYEVTYQKTHEFDFSKIFLFVPSIADQNDYLNIVIKQLISTNEGIKNYKVDVKMSIGRKKINLLADSIYLMLSLDTKEEISLLNTGNIIFKLEEKVVESLHSTVLHLVKILNKTTILNSIEDKKDSESIMRNIKIKVEIPNLIIELGKKVSFIDYSFFMSVVSVKLSSLTLESTYAETSSYKLNSVLVIELVNTLTHNRLVILDNVIWTLFIDRHYYSLTLSKIKLNLDSYSMNFLNKLKILSQGNPIPLSKVKNCTSYVFEFIHFNEGCASVLKPNEEKEIFYKNIKLRLTINDITYENTFDISSILISFTAKALYSQEQSDTKKFNIDYKKISLYDEEKLLSRDFFLFFKYLQEDKDKVDLIIFDKIIMINTFPSIQKNIFDFLTSTDLTSVDKFYNESSLQNLHLKSLNKTNTEVVVLSLLCDNTLFVNFLSEEIEVEINYMDKKEIITIPSKDEKSIMIVEENLLSIFFVYKSKNVSFYSEDLKTSLNKLDSFNKIKLTQKSKSQIYLNYVVEDFNKSQIFYDYGTERVPFTIKSDQQNKQYNQNKLSAMKIIKILPSLVIKNLIRGNNFILSFIPSDSVKIKDNFFLDENKENNSGNRDLLYELENNLQEISSGEKSYNIQNFSSIKFVIRFKETEDKSIENYYFFSENFRIDKSPKDVLVVIKTIEYLFFIIRVKTKYFNDEVISITISSFLNFSLQQSKGIDNIIIKNKDEMVNSRFNILNLQHFNRNSENFNLDTFYSFNNEKLNRDSFNIEVSDVLGFVDLMRSIKNTFDLYINNDYLSTLNIKNLMMMDNYQINANNSLNFLNKVKNRIIHVRMLHYPIFICEFYSEHFNINKNTYLAIQNNLTSKFIFYIKTTRNSETMVFHCSESSENSFVLFSEIESLILEECQHDTNNTENNENMDNKDLIKKNYLIRYTDVQKNIDRSRYLVSVEKNGNYNSVILGPIKDNSEESKKFNLISHDFEFTYNISPFARKEISIKMGIKNILGNFISNNREKIFNVSFADINISSFFNEVESCILQTKYLCDLKIQNSILYLPSIEEKINIYSMKVNLPLQTNLNLEDSLFQLTRLAYIQLNLSLYKNNNIKQMIQGLTIPEIEKVYIIKSLNLNDFSLNINLEYKKALSFSIKNSKLTHNKSEIKNISGSINHLLKEIQSNLMKNFLNNLYNIFKSTELFGNFNGFITEISEGYKKFKENPFTTGIFSLLYSSIKGSFNSFYGIGKSLTKSLKHISSSYYESPVLKLFYDQLRHFLFSSGRKSQNLLFVNFLNIAEYYNNKSQLAILSKEYNNNSLDLQFLKDDFVISSEFSDFYLESLVCPIFAQFTEKENPKFYQIKTTLKCKHKETDCLLIMTNYFICLFKRNLNNEVCLNYLLPIMEIQNMKQTEFNVSINFKNGELFDFQFDNGIATKILAFEIKDKFD